MPNTASATAPVQNVKTLADAIERLSDRLHQLESSATPQTAVEDIERRMKSLSGSTDRSARERSSALDLRLTQANAQITSDFAALKAESLTAITNLSVPLGNIAAHITAIEADSKDLRKEVKTNHDQIAHLTAQPHDLSMTVEQLRTASTHLASHVDDLRAQLARVHSNADARDTAMSAAAQQI